MKPVRMFMFEACPHCQRALAWMEECKKENPEYANVQIEIIDEKRHPDIADQYDYYYVPCYFINENKVHEGAASKEIIRRVLSTACES